MNQPKRRLGLSLTCVLIGCVVLAILATTLHRASWRGTASSGEALSPASHPSRQVNFSSLPVAFEPNLGQTDPQVKYLARGNGYTLFLTSSEAVLSLASKPAPASKQKATHRFAPFAKSAMSRSNATSAAVIRMQVAGGNPHAQIAGTENLPGISNYFVGKDPQNWR